MENGIYYDIPHATYHGTTDRVSNSYLSRLNDCPASAKVPQKETDAMTFGRALHCYCLDGMAAFLKEVAIEPEVNKRTNAGKEELAIFQEANKGKAIITAEDLKTIGAMSGSIKAHPMASQLIGCGTNEVSVFWKDAFSDLLCKCRPDIIPGEIQRTLIDLKKTRDASPHGFQRAITSFGYHRQAAFYLDGMNAITQGGYDVFAFIAIEDAEPYRVEVYTLSPTFVERGRSEYQYLINIERRCREAGKWPNYQNAEVTEIEMPRYMAYQEG
ncbi:MAG: PD-(D/E)XK nuclease-like domain-containing protein [Desulfuromonadaceae bacterium]